MKRIDTGTDKAQAERMRAADYRIAAANFKRAQTIHYREQMRGLTDGSVQQTRRMALAVAGLQRAMRKYSDAQRNLFQTR